MDDTDSMKTYNLRLPEQVIEEVDRLVLRRNLEAYQQTGQRATRASVLRAIINKGIEVEKRTAPLPNPHPTETT